MNTEKTRTMKVNKLALFLLVLSIFAVTACEKEEYDLEKISPDSDIDFGLGTPIAKGSLTMDNLLSSMGDDSTSQYVETDENGLLHLKYEQVIDSFTLADYMEYELGEYKINIFEADGGESSDFTTAAFNSGINIPDLQNIIYYELAVERPDQELDSFTVKTGLLDIVLEGDFQYSGNYTVSFPTITNVQTGQQLQDVTFNINGDPNVTETVDLAGYKVICSPTANNIPVVFTLSGLSSVGDDVQAGDKIQGRVKVDILTLAGGFGWAGKGDDNPRKIEADTMEVSLNELSVDGDIYFNGIDMSIEVENNLGIPIAFQFDTLMAIYDDDSEEQLSGNARDLHFLRAPVYNDGTTVVSNVNFDTDATDHLQEMFSKRPQKFLFAGNIYPNHTTHYQYDTFYTALNSYRNFASHGAQAKATIKLDVPLDMELYNFTLTDTIQDVDFDLSTDDVEDVNPQATLLLRFKNGFPLDIRVQAYLYDSTLMTAGEDALLDSLFVDQDNLNEAYPYLLHAASPDASGRVDQTALTWDDLLTFKFDVDRFDNLAQTKYIIIKGKIGTKDAQGSPDIGNHTVKIYSDYKLDFKMAVKAGVSDVKLGGGEEDDE